MLGKGGMGGLGNALGGPQMGEMMGKLGGPGGGIPGLPAGTEIPPDLAKLLNNKK